MDGLPIRTVEAMEGLVLEFKEAPGEVCSNCLLGLVDIV